MLLGEHAVLHGRRALACAVSCRIRARLTVTDSGRLVIRSALGEHDGPIDRLRPRGPLRFVLAAVQETHDPADGGLEIEIESEFSPTVGLGSSAAVTVAVVAGLQSLAGNRQSLETFHTSLRATHGVQGLGSGTDVAASVWGGIVAYRAAPFEIRPLSAVLPISLVYSGSKKPTVDVVQIVEAARAKDPERFQDIFDAMDASVGEAVREVENGSHPAVGAILDRNQQLMRKLGVSNEPLETIIDMMKASPQILGAKISGSGLGDCVVGLGASDFDTTPFERIPVTMSAEGVKVE